MTKLKIDLKNGYLEVEGEEAFVNGIYTDYKDVLSLVIAQQSEGKKVVEISAAQKIPEPKTEQKSTSSAPKHNRGKSMESYKILGDLNLSPEGKIPLRKFMMDKNPVDEGGEVTAIIVYYLQKILGVDNVTLEHIYTCYKHVERKIPTALKQSLKDIKRRKGWIDCADFSKIRVTTSGENLVEHELPRSANPNKK